MLRGVVESVEEVPVGFLTLLEALNPGMPTGATGDNGVAKMWNCREISVSGGACVPDGAESVVVESVVESVVRGSGGSHRPRRARLRRELPQQLAEQRRLQRRQHSARAAVTLPPQTPPTPQQT
eukprot:COSAG01_NODE_13236_length_1615_cov_2.883905_2_plen_124_part_00